MKISIITPSYNSKGTIETAIKSVLSQDYKNFEHIIVDGASTDGTQDILKNYPHLIWISERDRGQVHAMNKAFHMSTGDIIVNLNADDQFLNGAFSSVVPFFLDEIDMIVGKVLVRSETPSGIREWVNDPKIDFDSAIRHWEPDAFCVNPLGYFYRREVQLQVPFLEESGAKHDLEFYIESVSRFRLKKIDAILGIFNHQFATQTARDQLFPSYWRPENFSFLERFSDHLSDKEKRKFRLDQQRGYQFRRHMTANHAFEMGLGRDLIHRDEVVFLPEDEFECSESRCIFVEHDRIGTRGDWIIPVLTCDKFAGKAISDSLKSLPSHAQPCQVYHIHQINFETITADLPRGLPFQCHQAIGFSLSSLFFQKRDFFKWKLISGVCDPISIAVFETFEILKDNIAIEDHPRIISQVLDYYLSFFDYHYRDIFGIDIFNYPFDPIKRYSIIEADPTEIFLYRLEDLPDIFSCAMEEYLGIRDLKLQSGNSPDDKPLSRYFMQINNHLRLESDILDKAYTSRFSKHFYTENELDGFRRSWSSFTVRPKRKPNFSNADIIYDIGLHEGQDTEFYLKKGFKVIGVDANPLMINKAKTKFKNSILSGQLVLINAGIVDTATDGLLPFFINERNSEWSSFLKEIAARDNCPYHVIDVPCTTLSSLINQYGSPYYIKIDIEGHDHIALRSLFNTRYRPKYISVENGNMGMLETLVLMGYDSFKYIQQNNVDQIKLPYPPREGKWVEHNFVPGSSGPFGDELSGIWKNSLEIRDEISKVWNLENGTKNPCHRDETHGWFDLHAKFNNTDNI